MTEFSPQQDGALKAVGAWLKAKPGSNGTPQVFRLFGYAGTGKTTLATHIVGDARQRLSRRLHDPQPDLPGARERRGSTQLRFVGRGAGLQSRADHHRRM